VVSAGDNRNGSREIERDLIIQIGKRLAKPCCRVIGFERVTQARARRALRDRGTSRKEASTKKGTISRRKKNRSKRGDACKPQHVGKPKNGRKKTEREVGGVKEDTFNAGEGIAGQGIC